MSLSDLSASDIAVLSGNNRNDGFGGDGLYGIIVLFLLMGMMNNGWGGGFGGGNGRGAQYVESDVQRGFDQQAVMSTLGDIGGAVTGGFAGVNQALCGGFAGVNATVNSGFANAETAATARQMADMNQMFNLQSALQSCCCENRSNIADLKSTVISENCADRQVLQEVGRDIITNQTQNTQRILDQITSDKIDSKNEKIAELQGALQMATLRESQTAQNAFIAQGLSNEVDQLYNRLKNCPVPAMPVYGMTPVYTCSGGCNCAGTGTGGGTTTT